MAPRPRSLLTQPNDGTQKGNRLYLRMALRKGAGQVVEAWVAFERMARYIKSMQRGCAVSRRDPTESGLQLHQTHWISADQLCPIGIDQEHDLVDVAVHALGLSQAIENDDHVLL